MGVFHGRDLLSGKYPTAIIIDSVNTAHFVPIKHPVGDYHFEMINNELYAFDTKGESYKWRQSLAKAFEFQIFFTDCFKPLSPRIKELELILEKNSLPKMSLMLHKVLSRFSKKEKRKFENIKLKLLIEDLEKKKIESPERMEDYQNMITYLKDLPIDEIVTPVKRVTEYLDSSFLAPDPKFMGSIRSAFETMDREDKIVNNVEIGGKKGLAKVLAVIFGIALLGVILYMAYEQGAFDGITGFTDSFDAVGNAFKQNTAISTTDLATQYPTPESAKAAVDSGEANLSDFPPNIQELIKGVKTPSVSP